MQYVEIVVYVLFINSHCIVRADDVCYVLSSYRLMTSMCQRCLERSNVSALCFVSCLCVLVVPALLYRIFNFF